MHLAQQAAGSRFRDPREAERRKLERQIYEATRHRAIHSHRQPHQTAQAQAPAPAQQQGGDGGDSGGGGGGGVELDWAGNVLRRRQRRHVATGATTTMADVLTKPQVRRMRAWCVCLVCA